MTDGGVPRWRLRHENLVKANANLELAVEMFRDRPMNIVEQAGLIQLFEIAWEQGWKAMREFLVESGLEVAPTPMAAVRAAFAAEFIDDGDAWMEAAKLRHSLAHEYNEERAAAALAQISERYLALFRALAEKLRHEAESGNPA